MGTDASEVADMLNAVCGATVETLRSDNDEQRQTLRRQLTTLADDLEPDTSDIVAFLHVLERWLAGTPPSSQVVQALDDPFRRVLRQMKRQVDAQEPASTAQDDTPPISETTLAQLVAAVVTAARHDDPAPARKLAARLVNIQGQLPESHREDAEPLFENLRAVLGGADPATLQPVPADPYASLWDTVSYLMSVGSELEATTRDVLLDRLVHNAIFVKRAGDDELQQALAQALLDVQRKALAEGEENLANLVAAIRSLLLGYDPTSHSSLLDGEELAAWRKIQRAGR